MFSCNSPIKLKRYLNQNFAAPQFFHLLMSRLILKRPYLLSSPNSFHTDLKVHLQLSELGSMQALAQKSGHRV